MDRGAGHARYRATLLSMESILDRAVCAVVAIALGAHLARGELDQFLVTTAVATCTLMAFLGLLLVFARKRRAAVDATPSAVAADST
jgi:NADH:ubiquinone oxidoreductase subunit K